MNNQTKRKTYVCKKLNLYEYLTFAGFKPYKVAVDKWNCDKLVWLYDDDDALQATLTRYYSEG